MLLQPSSLAPLSVGVLEPRRDSPGSSLQLSYRDPMPRKFSFNWKQALRKPYASSTFYLALEYWNRPGDITQPL